MLPLGAQASGLNRVFQPESHAQWPFGAGEQALEVQSGTRIFRSPATHPARFKAPNRA
jgi:hypothetical protein